MKCPKRYYEDLWEWAEAYLELSQTSMMELYCEISCL